MQKRDTINEPASQVPIAERCDVLVAGSGPAGIAAALAAARTGASTCLVERYGYLGGMMTGAHVTAVLGVGDGHGPKAQGLTAEIRERMERHGPVIPGRSGDYRVDAEVFKWQVGEMLAEAGVHIRLHTLACAPVLDGQHVRGAYVESKSGREAILAAVTVDATADADLAHRAGCGSENETHDVTLGYRLTGIDTERVERFRQESPEDYEEIAAEASRRNGGVMLGKSRYLKHIDVTDPVQLTEAELLLRHDYFQALAYLREYMPGYEKAQIAETHPQIGVRQSRRIHGEYTLTHDDLLASRHFPDGIGRLGSYLLEYRSYTVKGLDYDIPYRSLVPKGIDGLLVAGRSISCDYQACNTMRLIVPCLVTGQAAGCAAALSAQHTVRPRNVDITALRAALIAQGAFLGND